jgi:hypothetical protein
MNGIQISIICWLLSLLAAVPPGCPTVDGLNSPISILHEHIENLYKKMSVSSTDEIVSLVYYAAKDVGSLRSYNLIFSQKNNAKKVITFIGVSTLPRDGSSSTMGISHSIVKYIESDNIDEVRFILGLKIEQIEEYQCEDLKGKFASFFDDKAMYSFSAMWKNQRDSVAKDSNFLDINYQTPNSSSPSPTSNSKNADVPKNSKDEKSITDNRVSSQSSTIEISKNQIQNANAGGPFAINIKNNIIGNTGSDASNNKSTSLSNTSVNSDQNAPKSSVNSNSSPSIKKTTNTDEDLNYNYEFVNNWYDNFNGSANENQKPAIVNKPASTQSNVQNSNGPAINTSVNQNLNTNININQPTIFTGNHQGGRIPTISNRISVNERDNNERRSSRDSLLTHDYSRSEKNPPSRKPSPNPHSNPGIDTLLEKGMTYEQILIILKKNQDGDEAKKQIEISKRMDEEQRKKNLQALKEKEDKEFIQKLYLILSYRKRQEDANRLSAKNIRPTEFLYNNLYGNNTKMPATLGNQSFYTVIPENINLGNDELNGYLKLSSMELARIINQKEKQFSSQSQTSGNSSTQEWNNRSHDHRWGNNDRITDALAFNQQGFSASTSFRSGSGLRK